MKKNKADSKIKAVEDAIKRKFPDATIYEVRKDLLAGTLFLGVVPSKGGYDVDHIVEWNESGKARECRINARDYWEVGWNEEEKRPEYVCTSLLIHDDTFNVDVDAAY